ncbi:MULTISPECIES: TetR/AcrR family transcriptional regulator [Gordonia]|uniref:TetR family transcriptional regulator n=2 Tax=Gordonia TaxID=2053 RepID=A0ABN3H2U1_9ACTN|nr:MULTISPECIES: TetR/AcrR family transcriptional regulator [Gordonia]AUH69922.1 TetR/AcrR family transcriptional regulator [Gordonia sp. YC-JH1]KXT57114.1 TetR family transcriptional regulator [Gordonia sp. QH-12]GAC59275.1 putative TetR family transcriptional regulator [Gordonia sihwensis NBRC 108236]
MNAPLREPQQDRSRATRERLLASTVDLLATRGWAATTVAKVAEEAGVSRGAAQHHFPTREALFTAVIEQMYDDMTEDVGHSLESIPSGPGRIAAVVEQAVSIYTGTSFKAALQVWAAAASDPALADVIRPLEAKMGRAAHAFVVSGLDPDGTRPQAYRLAQITLDLARGFGLADTLTDDSRRRAGVQAAWVEQLTAALD